MRYFERKNIFLRSKNFIRNTHVCIFMNNVNINMKARCILFCHYNYYSNGFVYLVHLDKGVGVVFSTYFR